MMPAIITWFTGLLLGLEVFMGAVDGWQPFNLACTVFVGCLFLFNLVLMLRSRS